MGAQCRDLFHAFCATPPFLPERQVGADDEHFRIGKLVDLLIEFLGFCMADWCIE